MMFPDAYIVERRLRVLRGLPWPIPASMIMRFTDEDFDYLAKAHDGDAYWKTLSRIVARVQSTGKPSERSMQ
jgi:hypothetical protein